MRAHRTGEAAALRCRQPVSGCEDPHREAEISERLLSAQISWSQRRFSRKPVATHGGLRYVSAVPSLHITCATIHETLQPSSPVVPLCMALTCQCENRMARAYGTRK